MGGRQRRGAQSGPQKGADLQCEVEFPFNTACFGGMWPVQVRREESCSACSGKGIKGDGGPTKCRQCGGQGAVMQVMQTPIGVMQTQQTCPACGGNCVDPSCKCQACAG